MEVGAINFRAILKSEKYNGDDVELFVSGQPVWDYKVQNGKLKLIHEPVQGSDKYETITVGELKNNLKVREADLPIASETDDREIVAVQGVKAKDKLGINFVLTGDE